MHTLKALLFLSAIVLPGSVGYTPAAVAEEGSRPKACKPGVASLFAQDPLVRPVSFRGEKTKMSLRQFQKIAMGPLSESEWNFARQKAQELSNYYSGTGDRRKLKKLTKIIERLQSEPMAREILLSNPNTYRSYLNRKEGLAAHQLHLWQATGHKEYLRNSLSLAREQLAVWLELPTAPEYLEFQEFVLSITPPPPPTLRKGQKLHDPRVGAGIHTGMPPKLREFDRETEADRGYTGALRFLPVVFTEAAFYLDNISLTDTEKSMIGSFHKRLLKDQEATGSNVRTAWEIANQMSEAFHGDYVDPYSDVILWNISKRIPSEAWLIKTSHILGKPYDLKTGTGFYYWAEKRSKNCTSFETLMSLQIHSALWKVVSYEAGFLPEEQCYQVVDEARKTYSGMALLDQGTKIKIRDEKYRIHELSGFLPLQLAIPRLEHACTKRN